tara:strand:+ start:154 stop:438 length:285 start_codon:yes stop_codon:yes gene_type:complete
MDHLKNNSNLIFIFPLLWGVYEIRKLRHQLLDIRTLSEQYGKIAANLNQKINVLYSDEDVCFPVIRDLQKVTQKINKIFSISSEESDSEKDKTI